LTVAQVKPGETVAARAGAQALSLLAAPINAAVLRALADAPRSLFGLRRAVDSPPQTTMRARIRNLVETGIVERHRRDSFPGHVEYELAGRGRELLFVTDAATAWLASCPEGPTPFASGAARSALKALVGGWGTGMVHMLASRPLSLTELDATIPSVSYPSLERRLGAMRHEGLVEPLASQSRGTPYLVSDWLRRAVAPLAAAIRWELRRSPDEAPALVDADIEAAFLLALPLIRLPSGRSGACRLGMRVERNGGSALVGAMASVRDGKVEACQPGLRGSADCWATGTPGAWFDAMLDGNPGALSCGGSGDLAREAVSSLREALVSG